MKPHPIVRVFDIILILSALVFLAPWRGDETTAKGLDSPFQIHQVLDAGVPHRPQKAIALPTQQYVWHKPIKITKNADFAALGFPGEGSPSNPYVIEGLDIKSMITLIHIQDTTAYFGIQNNLLTGDGRASHGHIVYPDGIYLQNVVHGTIDTNIITYCKSGIHLNGSEQTSVAHNTVSNCSRGIRLEESWQNNLTNNTLSNNSIGIRLSSSGQNTLVGNSLVNNGLEISGDQVEDCLQAIVAENVVNGRPVVYWQSVQGGTVPPGAGQVLLINTTGVEVTGQNLSWTSIGVLAAFSSHLAIHYNTLSNNSYRGISLSHAWNGTVSHNTLSSHGSFGIYLWDTMDMTISDNTFSNCMYGIYLRYSEYNIVSHNTVSDCVEGIRLHDSDQNTIAHNTVFNCKYGINLWWYAEYNTLVYNTIYTYKSGIHIGGESEHNIVDHNTVIIHSLSAPTVLFPNGGETLQGTVTLHWMPTNDTWEHSVTYTVSYSADDGHTWIPLASGLTRPSYEWNATTVKYGSAYRIQVVATCSEGLTAEDRSDAPFTIQNPTTTITILTTVTSTSLPPVGAFPTPEGPVGILLATLLLATIPVRRVKRKAR